MITKMFSVFDSKAAFFGNPFYEQREESAIRTFGDAVNDPNPKNMWNAHPEDYSLFYVGEFDSDTGEILPTVPKNLVTASALKSYASGTELGVERLNGLVEKAPR